MRIAWLALTASLAGCSFGVSLDGIFERRDGGVGDGGGPDVVMVSDGSVPSVAAVEIGAGEGFACALRTDGTVTCWGSNSDNRLGDGRSVVASSKPILVSNVTDAIDLSVGEDHACVVTKAGTVKCWGDNSSSALGNGTSSPTTTPVDVAGLSDVAAVECGGHFSCAIKKDRTVVCWGDNSDGQYGDGSTTSRNKPVPVAGLTDVKQLALSHTSSCALTGAGDVLCYGSNAYFQVGIDSKGARVLQPTKVMGLTGVKSITAGNFNDRVCALTASGPRCWGDGPLGNGNSNPAFTPQSVLNLEGAVDVATNRGNGCGVRASGVVYCWGDNDWRALGVGDDPMPTYATTPVEGRGLPGKPTRVAVGTEFACALLEGGKIACWGSNLDGRLGRGTRVESAAPVKAVFSGQATALSAGEYHTCVIDAAGAVQCWGHNAIGAVLPATAAPAAVPNLPGKHTRVGARSPGSEHTCAVSETGVVRCWGEGYPGQLGHGSQGSSWHTPVVFKTPSAATSVELGYGATCALLASGQVACSGRNTNNKLGVMGPDVSTPVLVNDVTGMMKLQGATRLAVGYGHACAIAGTSLVCWGSSYSGQSGSAMTMPNPVAVAGLPSPPAEVCAGGGHTCALLQNKTLACFGANGDGQLGAPGATGPTLRYPVLPSDTASAIACGFDHTCAIGAAGSVYCWGLGDSGQLGDGLALSQPKPVKVNLPGPAKLVAGGARHTCAALMDGSVYCWGQNTEGQLGDGSAMFSGVPANVDGY